ncbi:MAG TPA: diaminopimelate epimerase [Vicinamibacteria bacterium]|nr:diaminopimelate epimerase [Vicinamibacteria bacterium]
MSGTGFRWLILGELGLGVVALAWAAAGKDSIPFHADGRVLVLSLALTVCLTVFNFGLFSLGRRFRMAPSVYSFFDEVLFPLVRRVSVVELLVAAAIAGLSEELLFRGMLQPRIGLVAASLVFGLVHGPSLALLPLGLWATVVGLFLGVVYERSDNLAVPVLVHGAYDAVAFLFVRFGWHPIAGRSRSWNGASISSVRSIPFAKTEAYGNDFLLVSGDAVSVREGAGLARALCDRHRGVGGDGLILYAGRTMKLFNRDGSPAEISGNGVRCLAAFLYSRGLAGDGLAIETDAGTVELSVLERRGCRFLIRSNLGTPSVQELELPFELEGRDVVATIVSIGNPHCVLFTEAMDRSSLRALGPLLESHPRFPEKTNVELVEVVGRSEIRVGIWERGVGETSSSGTGSAASAVASIAKGLADSPLFVRCEGGTMRVEWRRGEDVVVEGEAVLVAEGTYFAEIES